MIAADQVHPASSNEILVVQALLLVDKWVSKGIFKPKISPEDDRYRLRLDCQPASALRFDATHNSWIVKHFSFWW
jgi:hypothetical protein